MLMEDAGRRARFFRDAQLASAIDHSNLSGIYRSKKRHWAI
jgi:hypothetical protein